MRMHPAVALIPVRIESAYVVSATLEATIRRTAFKHCFQLHLAPLHNGYHHVLLAKLRSQGRGLHSSTSQLNLSRVCHKKTPYTPQTSPNIPLTRATRPLRTPPIPYKPLKLS